MIAVLLGVIIILPLMHFRFVYSHGKRLREVDPGKLYRSGFMTARGFEDAIKELGLRTIVNFQDEYPDPDVELGFWEKGTIKESELCRKHHVNYVFIPPDLISRRSSPSERPKAIDLFLSLLDDPTNYPVLIHCRAGLNRTGVMTAVYRMEYNGWSSAQALEELKANGFGEWTSTSANDYIMQYIMTFHRGIRTTPPAP